MSPASETPQAVIVLGMHRSGTSALTNALAELGYGLPVDLMSPAADNPRGFFEPRSVARFNDRILKELGASWDEPGPFFAPPLGVTDTAARLAGHLKSVYLEDAKAILAKAFPEPGPIVIKDPRVALTAPLWRAAVEARGYRPAFVHIHRDPREVAASLHARNGVLARRGLRLWQTYVMGVLDVAATESVATVSYEQLLARPAEILTTLVESLGRAPDEAAIDTASRVLKPEDRHQIATQLGGDMPPLVADTARLLEAWDRTAPPLRQVAIDRLRARFEDASLYAGAATRLDIDSLRKPPPKRPPLLFHYHLFKNAGTSVDAMLKATFGDRWAHGEFRNPVNRPSNVAEVERHLRDRADIDVFSSHTALLPPPSLPDRDVLPILFVRHPIDRLRSAYEFESKQNVETFGARLARSTDFPGYIRVLLDTPVNTQARNFQAHRLAANDPQGQGELLARALRGLEALPFVGLVEAYDASIARLAGLVQSHYPAFQALTLRKNVSRAGADPLDAKLGRIAEELGPALYAELVAANQADLAIYDRVRALYPTTTEAELSSA